MSRENLTGSGAPRVLLKTLLGMYLIEASAVITCIILYKTADKSLIDTLSSRAGAGFALAAACLIFGLRHLLRDKRAYDERLFIFTVCLNLFSVLLLVVAAEVSLRLTIYAFPEVTSSFRRGMLPRDWNEIRAENVKILNGMNQGEDSVLPYLVADKTLGWTIGASRTGGDGLYASSTEGIRSATPDQSYGQTKASRKIALVGDSYTFGTRVAFEDSWGQSLQRKLGREFQVLNFGVGGYGVDQSYLRYIKDVQSWKPEITIFSLISHDMFRSQLVYPFITFSRELPFAKPRFVLEDGRAVLSNVPLPSLQELFTTPSIADLPGINLDPTYFAPEWEWRWYHHLYSIRMLMSASPRWPPIVNGAEEFSAQLNAAILSEFITTATRNGSRPVVVFFPSYGANEVGPNADATDRPHRRAHRMFTIAGIDYLDMTPCLRDVPFATALADDNMHYSATTNEVVATCLYQHLEKLLQDPSWKLN